MKLSVLVPSQEYKNYAGARIRYHRIAPELLQLGIEMNLEDIAEFNPAVSTCDILLISKCHDARSLIAAAEISRRGRVVGVDIFDDYFSDPTDSRLFHYRNWLSQLLEICHFALCSTKSMVDVAERYRSGLPTHILNDPAPDHSLDSIAAVTAAKLANARDNARIRVAWFGVGDNPYFPVGVADLAAFGSQLSALQQSGMDVELTVLTNPRALTARGLSLIGQLPVATQIREWRETAEQDVLREALIAFLPVRAQPFSTAKSLNRAVTALCSGCQIFSAGYPLYSALEPLVYRDPGTLVSDLARGSMRLSAKTIGAHRKIFEELLSAQSEARRLAAFLMDLKPVKAERQSRLSLIHGHSTLTEAHKLIQQLNGFSIASPYCTAPLDFDVVFRGSPLAMEMLITPEASWHLLPQMRSRFTGNVNVRGKHYLSLIDDFQFSHGRTRDSAVWEAQPVSFQLATYAATMSEIERQMANAFGRRRSILSEASPLPFQPFDRAA